MNSYVDNRLQQRKSSLSSLTKNRRQSSKILSSNRELPPNLLKQSAQNITLQKSTPKEPNPYQLQKKQTNQERESSLKKNNARLRDDESSDYIRNLYKKYLGKENKDSEKLNAFTERKLRTSESKELLSINTTAKDFTKRALFPDQQIEAAKPSLMKKQKNKISTVLCQQNQFQCQLQKSTQNNMSNSKTHFQSTKRESLKKNQKQNLEKQCQSKKSGTKNYKSKQKVQKSVNDEEGKAIVLKRSHSTQLKSEKYEDAEISTKKALKQGTSCELRKQSSLLKLKQTKPSLKDGAVHPHRESYCQFDTEQQIHKTSMDNKSMDNQCRFELNRNKQLRETAKVENNESKIITRAQRVFEFPTSGHVYSTYMNDLSTLEMLVGKENSLFQALQKIRKVKSNHRHQRRENEKSDHDFNGRIFGINNRVDYRQNV